MKPECYDYKWGGTPWKISGSSLFARWHENPKNVFRLVGKAHDIVSLGHTGWYLDEDGGETTHGLVFRLNNNKGFLAGGSDPDNDAAAYIETHENGTPYVYDSSDEAARAADLLAERYAESSREAEIEARKELKAQEEKEEADELLEAFSFAG